MKQVSSLIASALCLVCASAPAFANDTAKISQGGSWNNASVEQIASMGSNHVTVLQGENWYGGNNNGVQILQQNVHSSDVFAFQSGNYNQYTVAQYNGGNLAVGINLESQYYGDMGAEGNTVMVEQAGYDSRVSVEQGGSRYSRADVMQGAWEGGSVAEIVQAGEGNQASIFQAGSNQAVIYQAGYNLNASIMQNSGGAGYGAGNTALIRQSY